MGEQLLGPPAAERPRPVVKPLGDAVGERGGAVTAPATVGLAARKDHAAVAETTAAGRLPEGPLGAAPGSAAADEESQIPLRARRVAVAGRAVGRAPESSAAAGRAGGRVAEVPAGPVLIQVGLLAREGAALLAGRRRPIGWADQPVTRL